MKRILTLMICASALGTVKGQTITLQPAAAAGKDALLSDLSSTTNYGNHIDFASIAWTNGGTPVTGRSLVEFDLSGIPAGAIINSAKLSLYAYNSPSNGSHSSLSGSNESLIQRVTSSWAENTVTWATQPSTTTSNQVSIGPANTITDFIDIDVTAMVEDMLSFGNNGFMIRLATESYYRRMIFGSSDNTNSALRPKLVISYATCLNLRPGANGGKDALLSSLDNTTNYGNHIDFASIAWTNGGSPVTGRSLVEFDLTGVPAGSVIDSSRLSLYAYNSPSNGSHSALSGSNESIIQRVTTSWAENTVTWATQPSTSTTNQVSIGPASTITSYPNINVTSLVQDMMTYGNYGFMLRLSNESYYRRMIFASSDNTNSALHPSLKVCYHPAALPRIMTPTDESEKEFTFSLYPNPAKERVTIITEKAEQVSITLINSQGQVVHYKEHAASTEEMDLSSYPNGLYFVKVNNAGTTRVEKLIIE